MTFYSGLDQNLDANEKILASEFSKEARPRTALELNSSALDMSRAAGAAYDSASTDWWGIPRISVANQVNNMRKAANQNDRYTNDPWLGYVGEKQNFGGTGVVGGGGPWHGGAGGYLNPPQTMLGHGGYMEPVQASAMGGSLIPGEVASKLATSIIGPLVAKGVNTLSDKIYSKAKKYAEGSGCSYPLSGKERKYLGRPDVILSRDVAGLGRADEDILNSHSSGEFWNKYARHAAAQIADRVGDNVGGGSIYSTKYKPRVNDIASRLVEGEMVGSGMMSPASYKKIMNSKYDEDGSRVDKLRMADVLQPIIESAIEKGPVGKGMNAEEKQATLDLISEANGEGLSQPATREILAAGGGGFFGKIKSALKNVFRKASQSEHIRNLAGHVRDHVAEQLPRRLGDFAESGVDKVIDRLPESQVKNIAREHKGTIKKVARQSTEKLTKHLGDRAGAHIQALADTSSGTGGKYKRSKKASRSHPYAGQGAKKNWQIRL